MAKAFWTADLRLEAAGVVGLGHGVRTFGLLRLPAQPSASSLGAVTDCGRLRHRSRDLLGAGKCTPLTSVLVALGYEPRGSYVVCGRTRLGHNPSAAIGCGGWMWTSEYLRPILQA